MFLITCAQCGEVIEVKTFRQKFCERCGHKRKSNADFRHGIEHPITEIICCDCGQPFTPKIRRKSNKRCPDCREIKKLTFHAICEIRTDFATLAIIEPEEANAILNEMRGIEGEEFTAFALDGIPAKMKDGLVRVKAANKSKHRGEL